MLPAELVEKWKKLLGLRVWKIALRPDPEPPEPGRYAALTEYSYPSKEAAVWVQEEAEVIHELLHLVLAGMEHIFWSCNPNKSQRALWTRREERAAEQLEKAFLTVLRLRKPPSNLR